MALRAAKISVKDLSKAVDQAVKAVAREQRAKIGKDRAVITKWELVGRRLPGVDLATAVAFSEGVAKKVSKPGFKVEAATLVLSKGDILAGFFPVDQFNDIQL